MRVRVGFKGIVPLFPNAGVKVVRVSEEDFRELRSAMNIVARILALCGSSITVVCEKAS